MRVRAIAGICGLLCCLTFAVSPGLAEETVTVKAQDLTLQIPKSWKQEQTSSNLRLAQFSIPAAEGDSEGAELAVFPPFGGTVSENVKRWIDQFQAEGRMVRMTQGESGQGKYVLVDLSGTYNRPDGPPFLRKTKPVAGYRMLAVMLTSPAGGNYFLKLTGPEKTVAAAADQLRGSMGAKADQEKPFELE